MMGKKIVVLDTDETQGRELCAILEEGSYQAYPLQLLPDLGKCIEEDACMAVFIDIDTVLIDNRIIRDLTLKYPQVHFFCISKHPYNPELKDAICYHIYACLNRPVDPDEIFFWLRSIDQNDEYKQPANQD
jgi:DNA-binding NtrC family response regulator